MKFNQHLSETNGKDAALDALGRPYFLSNSPLQFTHPPALVGGVMKDQDSATILPYAKMLKYYYG